MDDQDQNKRPRDLPNLPPHALPQPSPVAFSPTRQPFHLDEFTSSYNGGNTTPTPSLPASPSRNSIHGNLPGSPQRFASPARPLPQVRSEWTRLESPVRDNDNTPITIDDDEDDDLNHHVIPMGPPLSSLSSTPAVPAHRIDEFENSQVHHKNTLSTDSSATEFNSQEFDDDDEFSYAPDDEYGHDEKEDTSELLYPVSSNDTISTNAYQAPTKAQPRRNKSMSRKQVKLVKGNLVLDCPVPTKLYSFLPRRDHDEFVYMRYTAATTDPNDFVSNGFTLRPAIYEREIQLCICITMYNEDELAFTRTMHAVMKNVAHLCSRNRSRVWGKDGWKKIVVCIVADGRTKVHPGVLNALAAMGVFQEGIAKNYVNGKEVKAHIFEYTTQVSLDEDLKFQGAEKGMVPVQIMFCLKEKNAKKINSHRWLFNGFCPNLNPNVCILLDVGTKPGSTSLYHLWKTFDSDSNIGGACGEIKAMTGKGGIQLLNPLVAAQNFEYKMSNILDKPLESVFGYISVLPGALSAYRYIALKNGPDGKGPLDSYFKGEFLHGAESDVFTSNMYLAEDRILCWELVAKKGEKWLLKYVKAATGETDVPDDVAEFISQRRRWLNGALFAAVYAQTHFTQIWGTDHSFFRKLLLHIEFFYQFISLIFTFFSLANFYLAFYFVAGSLAVDNNGVIPGKGGFYLFLIFKYLAICTISAQFILSLGNRPQGSKHMFIGSIVLLGLVGAYATGCGIYFVVKIVNDQYDGQASLGNNVFTNIVVSMASTYGIYALMSLLYLDPWHIVTSSLQYFVMVPAYVCTLQIYAFCNTHDVTWGTKGDNDQKMDLGSAVVNTEVGKDVVEVIMPSEQFDIDTGYEEALTSLRERVPEMPAPPNQATVVEDYYREVRTRVVLVWMIGNMLLVLIMTQVFGNGSTNDNIYLKIILWSVAALSAFRAIGSLAYLVQLIIKGISETRYKSFKREAFTGAAAPK